MSRRIGLLFAKSVAFPVDLFEPLSLPGVVLLILLGRLSGLGERHRSKVVVGIFFDKREAAAGPAGAELAGRFATNLGDCRMEDTGEASRA